MAILDKINVEGTRFEIADSEARRRLNEGLVTSFNNRTGAIIPESGDYSAQQISAGENSNVQSELNKKFEAPAGQPGQILGYDNDGGIIPMPAPATGVTSFNGRSGAVNPQSGDYTAEMVGALSSADLVPVNNKIDNLVQITETDPGEGSIFTGKLLIVVEE